MAKFLFLLEVEAEHLEEGLAVIALTEDGAAELVQMWHDQPYEEASPPASVLPHERPAWYPYSNEGMPMEWKDGAWRWWPELELPEDYIKSDAEAAYAAAGDLVNANRERRKWESQQGAG